jgi:hypothetical protein
MFRAICVILQRRVNDFKSFAENLERNVGAVWSKDAPNSRL